MLWSLHVSPIKALLSDGLLEILTLVPRQFTKREPEDTKSADSDRDIFNEKPSKEEVMAATQAEGPKRVSDSAIIHTTMGDVHIKLFPVE